MSMTLVMNDNELAEFYTFISDARDLYVHRSGCTSADSNSVRTTVSGWREKMREVYSKNRTYALVFDEHDTELVRLVLDFHRKRGKDKPSMFKPIYNLLGVF